MDHSEQAALRLDHSEDEARTTRLDALKARRKVLASSLPEPTWGSIPPPSPAAPPQRRASGDGSSLASFRGGSASPAKKPQLPQALAQLGLTGNSPKAQAMQKALKQYAAKLFQLLTKTPADAAGLLPGTPFTMSGIAKLSQMLRQHAGDPKGQGQRVAGMALQFLAPADPSQPSAYGLSTVKVQALWQKIEPMVSKGQGFPMAAAPRTGAVRPVVLANATADSGVGERSKKWLFDRALKIMSTTPADAEGMLEGTEFSRAGVARLMRILHEKAQAPEAKVAAAATEALRQLAPDPGDPTALHGASVTKLRTLSGRM